MQKLNYKIIQANREALQNAMDANPDTDESMASKKIDEREAIWQWEDNKISVSYGPGSAYRDTFYPTGDALFKCPCIDGGPGGPSPDYSTAFQKFKYDPDENMLSIQGDMRGRPYSVRIYLGN